MSAPDAAKFAFLFLNRGVWDGRRILSSAWIEESTRRHPEGHPWFGAYGLHCWLRPGMFYAMGYAGQYLFVIPADDLVVVFFSNLPRERSLLPLELLDERILPALRASP